MAVANVNGKLSSFENAVIGIADRGFLYGDSLYEVLFFRDGVPLFWQDHFARMHRSAAQMKMHISQSDSEIRREILKTVAFMQKTEHPIYVRWMVTRGGGPITLSLQKDQPTSLIIIVEPWGPDLDTEPIEGLSLKVTEVRRNPEESLSPNIKSGNYLNNILAISEANDAECDECLMLTPSGHMSELSRANIWLVLDGIVVTPTRGCLSGVTRGNLIKMISESDSGIIVSERDIESHEILKATEVFCTASSGSQREIWPIRKVLFENGQAKIFPSGSGEVTKRLQIDFEVYVQNYMKNNKTTFQ